MTDREGERRNWLMVDRLRGKVPRRDLPFFPPPLDSVGVRERTRFAAENTHVYTKQWRALITAARAEMDFPEGCREE